VDGSTFHTHGRRPYTKDRPFRFLSIGKYEQRKSLDETIDAFAQVYANTPAIELVIKSNYFVNHDQKLQQLKSKISDLSNVTLLWGEMPTDDMAELYRSCDAFVLPSRAEGWGLPLIEAAASGLPIVTTMYSGHTEFLQHIRDSILPVTYTIGPVACPEYQSYYPDTGGNWGTWARPDVVSIARAMQTVCRDYDKLFERACANSFTIRRTFTWQNSVDQAMVALGPIADFRSKSMTYTA
jgi:glycosyltransferase involved in cell wall biosynthesis